MGMYTAFHFKVKLKAEFVGTIRDLLAADWQSTSSRWDRVVDLEKYPDFFMWLQVDRRDFIPFGSGGFVPDSWLCGDDETWQSLDKDVWEVVCTLKNYSDEIQTFYDVILSRISEQIYVAETVYEENWLSPPVPVESGVGQQ